MTTLLHSTSDSLIKTTAKVKHVREEVTKKLDQYRKQYEEMHIRAITAELEASNLQLKLDQTARRLESEHSFTVMMIDEVTRMKSVQTNQSKALKKAEDNIKDIKEKLKREFDKINTNQKDMRIGINSLMRCVFEFKTGVISQNDFFAAVELIFTSLESNDRKLLSPSTSSDNENSSHLETFFNRRSLHELASLPPEKRRQKLEGILDHLSPEVLFSGITSDEFLLSIFDDSVNSLDNSTPTALPPLLPSPPSLPIRRNKPVYYRSKTSPLFPPPVPPRPSVTKHKDPDSDSESDFEEVGGVCKTRRKRISSESNITVLGTGSTVEGVASNRGMVSKSGSENNRSKPRVSMKRWKSYDHLLQSSAEQASISDTDSSENSGCYSFPFQHVQAWRNLIGLRDSSALTGSLPRLHSVVYGDDVESLYYIAPNEFRSIVAQVRGESAKIGGRETTEKVIKRVDSIISSQRHSRMSRLSGDGGYLSLLGDTTNPIQGGAGDSWLNKVRQQTKESFKARPRTPPPKARMRISYENHPTPLKAPIKEVPSPKDKKDSPVSPPKTFDDPLYDSTCNGTNDIYHESYSPSPPCNSPTLYSTTKMPSPSHQPSPSPRTQSRAPSLPPRPPPPAYLGTKQDTLPERGGGEISKRTQSSPVLPPKHNNKVDIQIRNSKVFSNKPVPKPRVKKESLREAAPKPPSPPPSSESIKHKVSSDKNDSVTDPLHNTVPAYFSLKRGTHSLQLIPQFYDSDSDGENDPSAYSLGTFELVKNHEGETTNETNIKKDNYSNTSDNSIDTDDDSSDEYEIPPDATLGYVEPSSYRGGSIHDHTSSDRKYTATLPNADSNIVAERQGYLHKLDPRLKHWTRRWFVLKGKELKYYSKKGASNCKGVINLAAWCKVTRHELTSSFQLATPLRTYHFVADSNTECEDWIKALQTVMRMCQINLTSPGNTRDIPADWARVKLSSWSHGHQKMWIALLDQSLTLYNDPNDDPVYTFSLIDALVRHSTDTPGFRCSSQVKEEFAIIVEVGGASNVRNWRESEVISLYLANRKEKDKWFYHLVSTASGETGPEITLTEKIVARLWRADSSTASSLWSHPVLNHTKEIIQEPLTSLPSSELGNEAVQIFKSVQLFITTPFDPLAVDYHIVSFQQLIGKCMSEPFLHDELYCQVLRQISSPSNVQDHQMVLQSWFLLALLLPHILPKRKLFNWYLKTFLSHQRTLLGSQPTIVAQLATLCEMRLSRMEKNGLREKKPSWYELNGLMCRPVHLTCVMQMKCSIPIHLFNDTTLTIDCDSCSTVQEVVSQLNQEIGMQDTFTTGFALMSDWPGEEDMDVFYLFPNSKLMDVVSMWGDSLSELGNSSSSLSRTIHLTYRNRLSFKSRRGQETDKEAVLLAYQYSKDVISDHIFIPTLEIALDIAARMAQIDYGDCASTPNAEVVAKDALRRFCCRRFIVDTLPQDLDLLESRLLHKWQSYHKISPQKCSRMLLCLLQDTWEFFGSSIFSCRDLYGTLVQRNANVWLAVNENGVSLLGSTMKEIVSYSYRDIATFGGHCDDFMLVVNSRHSQNVSSVPPIQTEKIVLSMPKFKIREATYLMASYLDY